MNDSIAMYSDIEVSTEVMSSSKHRLIQMLMQKGLEQIRIADVAMDNKHVLDKCNAIQKTMDIILHLRACLNFKESKTKDMSLMLEDAYLAIEQNLFMANAHNNSEHLQAAYDALARIKAAWDGISDAE